MRCVICNAPCERAHIKSRGSGGHDETWNVMALCRGHHIEQHKVGWKKLSEMYPEVAQALDVKGWEFLSWGKLVRK